MKGAIIDIWVSAIYACICTGCCWVIYYALGTLDEITPDMQVGIGLFGIVFIIIAVIGIGAYGMIVLALYKIFFGIRKCKHTERQTIYCEWGQYQIIQCKYCEKKFKGKIFGHKNENTKECNLPSTTSA